MPVFNRELIKWLGLGHDSFIECLAANARTRDGLKASTVIIDEYSQARNSANKSGADLKNVLTSSMGTRKEPLTVIITTASDVIDGPFKHELDGVMKVLRGEIDDDRMFASLFMPDPDDEDCDPRTWRKVQPHIGVTIQPDYYENEWKTAQLSEENMLNFRTKMLNVFSVNTARTWMDYDKANEILDKGESPLEAALQAPSTYQWRPSSCLHDRAQQQSHKRLLPLQLRHRRGPPREQEAHQGLAVPKNRRGHHAPHDARSHERL